MPGFTHVSPSPPPRISAQACGWLDTSTWGGWPPSTSVRLRGPGKQVSALSAVLPCGLSEEESRLRGQWLAEVRYGTVAGCLSLPVSSRKRLVSLKA